MTSSEASPQQKPKQNRNSGLWAASSSANTSGSVNFEQQLQSATSVLAASSSSSSSEASVVKLREKSQGN